MSNKQNPGQPGQPGSRREQLRAEQARAAKEKRVRNIITYVALGLGALVIVGGIIWGVIAATSANKATPSAGAAGQYTVTVGKADAPVTIDIYQDYMCPYCGQFERTNSGDVAALVADGTAKVQIHPMAFLDDASQGTKYSTRAANALVTVYKAEPDKALAFNSALYANQPAENSSGLTDAQIADIAVKAGVSQTVASSFTSMANASFVADGTNAAFAEGVTSTPTVKINGKQYSGDLYTAGAFKSAVLAAAGK